MYIGKRLALILLAIVLLLMTCFIPIIGAYVYSIAPAWLLIENGVPIFMPCIILGIGCIVGIIACVLSCIDL